MGLMLRVRLSSFFAGAASASVAGFYFLYKDYKLAQEAISHQVLHPQPVPPKEKEIVREGYESLEERFEGLSARITTLEGLKKLEAAPPAEGSE